jgi:DNA (cytosine-5)-methyltransferase 1
MGYYRAGFEVTGVDVRSQPNYPFKFIQSDALKLDYDFLLSFDVIHASPPCQQYSRGSIPARKRGKQYPDLFIPTRRMLAAAGLPYIMENVLGSPAKGIRLFGDQFGLEVLRERIFESNMPLVADLPRNKIGSVKTGEYVTVAGKKHNTSRWAKAMGIDWAATHEIKEAIPPAYTEYLGLQVRQWLHEHRRFPPAPHFLPDNKMGMEVWQRSDEYLANMSSQVSHFDPTALEQQALFGA